MRGIVEELLLHNSYLTGKLEQSVGHENKETQILTAVNKTLQTSKRLETAVKKTAKAEPRQPSYAEKVKITSNKVGQIAVKPPKNVVIIRPETPESEIKTSEDQPRRRSTSTSPASEC
jgi:sRNA-binding carbon storage regulator CsrA